MATTICDGCEKDIPAGTKVWRLGTNELCDACALEDAAETVAVLLKPDFSPASEYSVRRMRQAFHALSLLVPSAEEVLKAEHEADVGDGLYDTVEEARHVG